MPQLGRYEIIAEIGRGAMGTVYRARDPKIDRIVALKTINVLSGPALEDEYLRRFFREAQAAGKLLHPGIVTIFDVGEDEASRTPYIVMEFVPGRTLEELLAASGAPLAAETGLDLVKQVAEALDYAHANGIVHRDIKPANILITEDGRAKIADFGVARQAQAEFTVPGQILGTPSYMSPEQLKGDRVDGRSDLFSLGVILYRLLTGQKPFSGDTSSVLYQVACVDPPPVSQVNPDLLPELNQVAGRALAKDPAARYQTGKELAADLEDTLQGRTPRSQRNASAEAAEGTVIVGAAAWAEKTAPGAPASIPRWKAAARDWRSRLALLVRRLPVPGFARLAAAFPGRLPGKVRIALAFALMFLVCLPLLYWAGTAFITPLKPQTLLRLRAQHNFRSANLTVWVDGNLILDGKLIGAVRKRWFKTTVQGTFLANMRVPAGKRTVRVRVSSPQEGYDQNSELTAELPRQRETTLLVAFGEKTRGLQLSLQE